MKQSSGVPAKQSQRGMASIIITMVTMVVISLIVLGFATISRREARQSLDQLQSTQAFYAAESGVEDARRAIKLQMSAGMAIQTKSACINNDLGATFAAGAAYPATTAAMKIDENIAYTCLQVDPSPDSLQFDGVSSDSTVVPLSTTVPFQRLEITWQPKGGGGTLAGCPANTTKQFKPQSGANAWSCSFGVMRLDLTTQESLTRAGLAGNTYSAFYQPVSSGAPGTDSFSASKASARLVAANCSAATSSCKAIIDHIGAAGVTSASLRLSSIYQQSDVKIEAYQSNGVGGSPLEITGTQAEIDVTGRAYDVLRRIKVRLPLISTNTLVPGNAITSNGSICKRFSSTSGYLNIGSILDADSTNDMCQPHTSGTLITPSTPSAITGNASVVGPPTGSPGVCGTTCVLPGHYSYRQYFTNSSTNPPANVVGCTWDYGDGTIETDVACNQGNTRTHDYPVTPVAPYPAACGSSALRTQYITTLTVKLIDGSTYKGTKTNFEPTCYQD